MKRAEAAGYEVLVDSPDLGRRLANIGNNFFLPYCLSIGNFKPKTSQTPLKSVSLVSGFE